MPQRPMIVQVLVVPICSRKNRALNQLALERSAVAAPRIQLAVPLSEMAALRTRMVMTHLVSHFPIASATPVACPNVEQIHPALVPEAPDSVQVNRVWIKVSALCQVAEVFRFESVFRVPEALPKPNLMESQKTAKAHRRHVAV